MFLLFSVSEYELINCLKVTACINHCVFDNHLSQVYAFGSQPFTNCLRIFTILPENETNITR